MRKLVVFISSLHTYDEVKCDCLSVYIRVNESLPGLFLSVWLIVWCTNSSVNNILSLLVKETESRVTRASLLFMTCHQASRNLYFVKKTGKKWAKKRISSTAVLYIHTSLCDFNASSDFGWIFFFLKHANINSNIKFLYHVCIQTWLLCLFIQIYTFLI